MTPHPSPHHEWIVAKANGTHLDCFERQDEPGDPGDPPREAFSIDLPAPWAAPPQPGERRSRADLIVRVVRVALWLIMGVLIVWLMKGGG